MKNTIAYIHGWGGSPEGKMAQAIARGFPGDSIICPYINYHSMDPRIVRYEIEVIVAQLFNTNNPIVVGSCIGGFWADYAAAIYGIKSVLINPLLHPDVGLRKYTLPEHYYEQYTQLRKAVENYNRDHVVVIVGEHDNVVPVSQIQRLYRNPIIIKGEGHKLRDVTPVINVIKSVTANNPEGQCTC